MGGFGVLSIRFFTAETRRRRGIHLCVFASLRLLYFHSSHCADSNHS